MKLRLLVDFNGSIWHAFCVLLPLAAVVFLLAFCSLGKDHWYFFDPRHNTDERLKDAGDFEPHAKRYQDLAKLIITLSAATIAFLISVIANDKSAVPAFLQKVHAVVPIVIGFFGACIALLMAFMVLQTYWYEQYCASPDHSSYKRWKYSLSISLGWTGLLSFVLGFGWLAANLFNP